MKVADLQAALANVDGDAEVRIAYDSEAAEADLIETRLEVGGVLWLIAD